MVRRSGKKGSPSTKSKHQPANHNRATTIVAPSKDRTTSSTINRPRNLLITDATQPFIFSFTQYGSQSSITVHQTPDEQTWPGGALWDLGVLLSQVLVILTRGAELGSSNNQSQPSSRLLQSIPCFHWKDTCVLELGCGVGLTGLVAGALGARLTVLTDLDDVIRRVTQPNVERNSTPGPNKSCGYRVITGGKILAMPLCWGNENDEEAVLATLQSMTAVSKSKHTKDNLALQPSLPDVILIGDVAYQHKPGAPSHFEALHSTLLKFMNESTLVVFGTRMRMPASADLLEIFHEDLEEVLVPPLEADELDPSFRTDQLSGRKHGMTIHFLRKKRDLFSQG